MRDRPHRYLQIEILFFPLLLWEWFPEFIFFPFFFFCIDNYSFFPTVFFSLENPISCLAPHRRLPDGVTYFAMHFLNENNLSPAIT